MVEQELKYQLSRIDFLRFKNYLNINCKKLKGYNQINYYLDTKNIQLKNKDISLRIRNAADNQFECTIKVPLKKNDTNIHVNEETTVSISYEILYSIINGIKLIEFETELNPIFEVINPYININEIGVIGQLQTERSYYLVSQDLEPINIDKNRYFNITDYEIEWETSNISKSSETLYSIFNKLSIVPLNSNASKSSRFFNVYKSLNSTNFERNKL